MSDRPKFDSQSDLIVYCEIHGPNIFLYDGFQRTTYAELTPDRREHWLGMWWQWHQERGFVPYRIPRDEDDEDTDEQRSAPHEPRS